MIRIILVAVRETEIGKWKERSETMGDITEQARTLGRAAADAYWEEFEQSPRQDGSEWVGDWDASAWSMHWPELRDAGATEEDYDACLDAWRTEFWECASRTARFLNGVGKLLDTYLNPVPDVPHESGFLILVFPKRRPRGRGVKWRTNAEADDAIRAVREWLDEAQRKPLPAAVASAQRPASDSPAPR